MAEVAGVYLFVTCGASGWVIRFLSGQDPWHSRGVSDAAGIEWLTVPDVCERMNVTPGRVHRLVEDRALLGMKIDGIFKIPAVFFAGNEPLGELRGTSVVLLDGGYSDEEAVNWLLSPNDSLGVSPIEALRSGRKSEVRRLAQTLAL